MQETLELLTNGKYVLTLEYEKDVEYLSLKVQGKQLEISSPDLEISKVLISDSYFTIVARVGLGMFSGFGTIAIPYEFVSSIKTIDEFILETEEEESLNFGEWCVIHNN